MIDYTELIKELEVQAEKQKSVLLAVAADVIEKLVDDVERKHGKWINPRPDSEMCSSCGVRFSISSLFAVGGNEEPNFCPNCGADMREREGE